MNSSFKKMQTTACVSLMLFLYQVQANGQDQTGIYNGHVEYVQQEQQEEGAITLNATGFSKKIADSKMHAIQSAFYRLLFRGIDGSKYNQPLVADENEKKNDPVIKKILNEGYNTFIIKNTTREQDKKERKVDGLKGYQCTLQLTINVDALRRYLEENHVIRKFGF